MKRVASVRIEVQLVGCGLPAKYWSPRMLKSTARAWVVILGVNWVLPAARAESGTLFPEPFRIEHHLVHDDGSGEPFVGETVVDTYGGSWLVSERPDGGRVIVDFARREITEVRASLGSYWTVTFDQLGAIERRLWAAQMRGREGERDPARQAQAAADDELVVTTAGDEAVRSFAASGAIEGSGGVARHLPVARRSGAARDVLDVWVDPGLVVGPAAAAAIDALGAELAGADGGRPTAAAAPGRYLAAARGAAGGAWVVRTVRPAVVPADGEPVGTVEDVTTKIERLASFPSELATVPEGLRRTVHPLEAAARLLEEDAVRDAAMAGHPITQAEPETP